MPGPETDLQAPPLSFIRILMYPALCYPDPAFGGQDCGRIWNNQNSYQPINLTCLLCKDSSLELKWQCTNSPLLKNNSFYSLFWFPMKARWRIPEAVQRNQEISFNQSWPEIRWDSDQHIGFLPQTVSEKIYFIKELIYFRHMQPF